MANSHTELVRRVRLDDIPARQQGTCKNVLSWIAWHASEEEADIAYPGIEVLELETGLQKKAIVTATETLARHEWLSKKRRLGTSNIYRLNVRKLREHYVPKGPSKVTKLIDELPELGFSHETEPGSDADLLPDEDNSESSENSTPQSSDQHLCSENTTEVSSRHGRGVPTTRQGCSHDTQTVREPSGNRQTSSSSSTAADPASSAADHDEEEGMSTDGGEEPTAQPAPDISGTDESGKDEEAGDVSAVEQWHGLEVGTLDYLWHLASPQVVPNSAARRALAPEIARTLSEPGWIEAGGDAPAALAEWLRGRAQFADGPIRSPLAWVRSQLADVPGAPPAGPDEPRPGSTGVLDGVAPVRALPAT